MQQAVRAFLARRRLHRQRARRASSLGLARAAELEAAIIVQCAVRSKLARTMAARLGFLPLLVVPGGECALPAAVLGIFAALNDMAEADGEAQRLAPSAASARRDAVPLQNAHNEVDTHFVREGRVRERALCAAVWAAGIESRSRSMSPPFLARGRGRAATAVQCVVRGHQARLRARKLAGASTLARFVRLLLIRIGRRKAIAGAGVLQRVARFALAALTPAVISIEMPRHSYLLYAPLAASKQPPRVQHQAAAWLEELAAPPAAGTSAAASLQSNHERARASLILRSTARNDEADALTSGAAAVPARSLRGWLCDEMMERRRSASRLQATVRASDVLHARMGGIPMRLVSLNRVSEAAAVAASVLLDHAPEVPGAGVMHRVVSQDAPVYTRSSPAVASSQPPLASHPGMAASAQAFRPAGRLAWSAGRRAAVRLQRVLRGHRARRRVAFLRERERMEIEQGLRKLRQEALEQGRHRRVLEETPRLQARIRRVLSAAEVAPARQERAAAARALAHVLRRASANHGYVSLWLERSSSGAAGWIQGSVGRALDQLNRQLRRRMRTLSSSASSSMRPATDTHPSWLAGQVTGPAEAAVAGSPAVVTWPGRDDHEAVRRSASSLMHEDASTVLAGGRTRACFEGSMSMCGGGLAAWQLGAPSPQPRYRHARI